MGEDPHILDLWKRYVDEGKLPHHLPWPKHEHEVIKEGLPGEERTGLYYSVYGWSGALEYRLLILPEDELPRENNAYPTHHLRAVKYVRNGLRKEFADKSRFGTVALSKAATPKLASCIGFTVEKLPLRFQSCANAHANGVTSRRLTEPQILQIEEFVAAALKRRADELKKKAAAADLQAETLEAVAARRRSKNSRSGCNSSTTGRMAMPAATVTMNSDNRGDWRGQPQTRYDQKRQHANPQQRREEAEFDDDEVEEAGTFQRADIQKQSRRREVYVLGRFKSRSLPQTQFQRASQEKLSKRRIVSVSGRFKSRSSPQMQEVHRDTLQRFAPALLRPSFVAAPAPAAGSGPSVVQPPHAPPEPTHSTSTDSSQAAAPEATGCSPALRRLDLGKLLGNPNHPAGKPSVFSALPASVHPDIKAAEAAGDIIDVDALDDAATTPAVHQPAQDPGVEEEKDGVTWTMMGEMMEAATATQPEPAPVPNQPSRKFDTGDFSFHAP